MAHFCQVVVQDHVFCYKKFTEKTHLYLFKMFKTIKTYVMGYQIHVVVKSLLSECLFGVLAQKPDGGLLYGLT